MAIRVGQLGVQYVADTADNSDLRVTRMFAQAVIPADAPVVRAASNAFGWSAGQSVVMEGFIYMSAANVFFDGASDNEATYDPVFNVFVSQSLFNGTDTVEALYFEASNVMGWTAGEVASPDQYIEVVQYMGWTDRKFAPDTGNVFNFQAVATIAVIESCANYIFTSPTSSKVLQGYLATNSLGWTDTVAASADVYCENKFSFVDAWTFSGTFDYNANPSGGGFLRQSVGFTIDDNTNRELKYDPIIGSTDDDEFEDFRVTPPVFATGTVQFEYPPTNPTNTLTLDDPDFGESKTLNFTRIDRTTRGGDRKIYADRKWATWQRLSMTVSGLCQIDADDIIDFLNASLGKKVKLTDWEGQVWEGFIDEVGSDIVKERQGWKLDIVFEAEVTTAFVEHDELIVTHNVNPGDDFIVTHDL